MGRILADGPSINDLRAARKHGSVVPSIWIDHLRQRDERLSCLLDQGRVLAHPFVIGELALGNLQNRDIILGALQELPQAPVATDAEVLGFNLGNALYGMVIGYIDAHLLAAMRLAPGGNALDTRQTTACGRH